jgi:hypothetical protein
VGLNGYSRKDGNGWGGENYDGNMWAEIWRLLLEIGTGDCYWRLLLDIITGDCYWRLLLEIVTEDYCWRLLMDIVIVDCYRR